MPLYKYWSDFGEQGKPIIYAIWTTWFANIMFTSILMLNFLITVFSETHERVLSNSIIFKYSTRLGLNLEAMAFMKALGLIGDIDYIVLCSPVIQDEEADNETLGVINSLTSVI